MRNIIFVIASVLTLIGCSKSESYLADINNRKEITFQTYAAENTKGLPIADNASFEKEGTQFELSAFGYTANTDNAVATTPYFGTQTSGLQITRTNNAWRPALTMYWPTANNEFDFFAIKQYNNQLTKLEINPIGYPHYRATNINNTTSSISFRYDTDAATKITDLGVGFTEKSKLKKVKDSIYTSLDYNGEYKQDDIMYATTFKTPSPHADTYNDALGSSVKLSFKHALTQIQFKAETEPEIKVFIKAITIHNIQSKGTFTQVTTNRTGEPVVTWYTGKLTATNMFNVSIPWKGTTISPSGKIPLSYAEQDGKIIYTDHTLMLIPQAFTAWNPKTATIEINNDPVEGGALGAYIMVYCDIYLKTLTKNEGHIFGDKKELWDNNRKPEAAHCIYLPLASTDHAGKEIWKAGNKITYNLIFGGGYDHEGNKVLNPIDFTITVDNWNKGDDNPIDPPLENDTNAGSGEDLIPGEDLTEKVGKTNRELLDTIKE